ncbi:hypothetical protein DGWBC_0589 [Dehalogenimonas sp. WBC-2]|nr:hypothetical protein DGWBC_0589 [Dehalogenimonas sp. WBC-2]
MPIIDMHTGRQSFDFDCGPKSLQLVLAYYGVELREDQLLLRLGSNHLGTRISDMTALAESFGFVVEAHSGVSLAEVKKYVDELRPVIVLVQAWADKYMSQEDWRQTNEHGHYVVVIGYREHTVLFEDPATFGNTWLTEREFLSRWHDVDPVSGERLEHFAMVLKGKMPAPIVARHMD